MLKVRPKRFEKQAQWPDQQEKVTIGVDLSRTKWVYSCRWSEAERRGLSSPGEIEHLVSLAQGYLERGSEVRVVYEACGFGYRIAWRLQELGIDVLIVAPSTVEKAPGSGVKTDGLDASSLAFKHEKGLLKGIYIPDPEHHDLRQVSRTYEQVMGDRRKQQARLRLMLQEHSYAVPPPAQGWTVFQHWLKGQELEPGLALSVAQLVAQRKNADVSVKQLKKELEMIGRLPRYATVVTALSEQSGVGPLTAIRFALEMGTMDRFPTAGSLPNYLGLTPGEYSSGEMVHRGHVRKCGPGEVRGWLIQCAWAAVRARKDTALIETFERLAPRTGKKRAIVAIARKLSLRLRARWLEAEKRVAVAA